VVGNLKEPPPLASGTNLPYQIFLALVKVDDRDSHVVYFGTENGRLVLSKSVCCVGGGCNRDR
jgi:hypothetical protein